MRPYLYRKAMDDARALYARVVTEEEAKAYGLHGLRVAGYDEARRRNRELAVAHGGWESTAHANLLQGAPFVRRRSLPVWDRDCSVYVVLKIEL